MFNGFLKKGTATAINIGPLVDNSDFKTPKNVTVSTTLFRVALNGVAFGAKSASDATYRESGIYMVSLDAADTSAAGVLTVIVSHVSTLPWAGKWQVLTSDTYDGLFGNTSAIIQSTGVVVTSIRPDTINVSAFADSAISAVKIADSAITANKIASDAITAAKIATSAFAESKFEASVFDRIWATTVEDAYTAVQFQRGFAAVLFGTASGMATTTNIFKSMDAGINRVSATTDADGNRTAIALSLAP